MRRLLTLCFLISLALPASAAKLPSYIANAKTIAFFGDSITNDGRYISIIEYHLRRQGVKKLPLMVNLGLPSETCSGLSEPDHPFPRPNVHERLERALGKLKPDVVVACYGMNDGIYYPFSKKRFAAFKNGVQQIVAKVKKTRAKLVLMTPPAFDPLPMKRKGKLRPKDAKKFAWFGIYENYDDVMAKYAGYVKSVMKPFADDVIDLHAPVNRYLQLKRKANPNYVMSGDGVHINLDGHKVLANAIMKKWGMTPRKEYDQKMFKLVLQRQAILHAAWLSHVGHKRPGVKAGLPIAKAKSRAAQLEKKIQERLGELE